MSKRIVKEEGSKREDKSRLPCYKFLARMVIFICIRETTHFLWLVCMSARFDQKTKFSSEINWIID